jgi:hypothetical protein
LKGGRAVLVGVTMALTAGLGVYAAIAGIFG